MVEVGWTREGALQAVETGVVTTWAGIWFIREERAEIGLAVHLEKLRFDGTIVRDRIGRFSVARGCDR